MKAFESLGNWWLPDDESNQVAGTLTVSQNGEMRLRLLGALGANPGHQSKRHPVILGWVEISPLGDIVTLANCFLKGSSFDSHKPPRETYYASRGYFGAHLASPEEFLFNSMSLRLGGLSEWASDRTGYGNEQVPAAVEKKTALLTYSDISPLAAEVPGGRLSLGVTISSRKSIRDKLFQEVIGLSVTTEVARSADEFNSHFVYPLQNLMTFVCDRPQEVEDFVVQTENDPENLGRNLHVIGARVQPEQDGDITEPVYRFEMLFTLADVDFADFVGKWLRVTDRFSSACNTFFSIQYGPPAFIDLTFPSIVQSLYLYHVNRVDGSTELGKEEGRLKEILTSLVPADADWLVDRLGVRPFPPLQMVLRRLVEEHAHIMNSLVSHRLDRFVSEVANTLRYITFREPEMRPAASHSADLYWMMQKLRFLFKSCLLHELGFGHDKIKSLFEKNRLYQHIRQIEETAEHQRQKG